MDIWIDKCFFKFSHEYVCEWGCTNRPHRTSVNLKVVLSLKTKLLRVRIRLMSVTMTVVATLLCCFLSIASFRACRPSLFGIFV